MQWNVIWKHPSIWDCGTEDVPLHSYSIVEYEQENKINAAKEHQKKRSHDRLRKRPITLPAH